MFVSVIYGIMAYLDHGADKHCQIYLNRPLRDG